MSKRTLKVGAKAFIIHTQYTSVNFVKSGYNSQNFGTVPSLIKSMQQWHNSENTFSVNLPLSCCKVLPSVTA